MTDKDKKSQSIKASAEEDSALWKRVIADVKPLKGREEKDSRPEESLSAKVSKAPKKQVKSSPVLPPGDKIPIDKSGKISAGRHEVDRRTLDRLKRGQIPIEAILDLHGMSQIKAHHALERFILQAYAQGRRCVLVITGKGTQRTSEVFDNLKAGVLKQRVPEWLREQALHDAVLKVQQARPKDGGAGALYVLLRRKR